MSELQEILGPNTTDQQAKEFFQELRTRGIVLYACSSGRGCNPRYLVFSLKVNGVVYPMPPEYRDIHMLTVLEYARFSELWGKPMPDVDKVEIVWTGKAKILGVEYST